MKRFILSILVFVLAVGCSPTTDMEAVKKEVFETEKAFEKMAADKGVPEAFYFFADENGVIKRDSLIKGKDNIRNYYQQQNNSNATVNWTPDFIEVSNDGTLAYTYGKYVWKVKTDSSTNEYKGVFHTVWKRQSDNSWKYVWD